MVAQLLETINGNHFKSRPKVDNSLSVTDNRTGGSYHIAIDRNSINATDFKQMKAPQNPEAPCDQTEYGIRVYDPGFGNTAVSESKITYK